jgi:hypothetical protein
MQRIQTFVLLFSMMFVANSGFASNPGDYYDLNGKYLGTDSIDDGKVYVATGIDTARTGKDRFTLHKDLNITHSQFKVASNIIRYESVDGNKLEVLYIAHTVHNRARELSSDLYSLLMTRYSSVPSSLKKEMRSTSNDDASNNTRAAVIDVLLGKPDPTDGATFWDGTDFLAWGLRSPNGTPQNKFEEYKSIVIPMDVFYTYLDNHCHHYPRDYVKYRGRVFQYPAKVFLKTEHWVDDKFTYRTGYQQPYGLVATVTAGLTIFWKTVE